MRPDPAALIELRNLLAVISASADPRRATDEWKQVFRLLQKCGLPAERVAGVVGMRDVEGFAGLLDELERPSPYAEPSGMPDAETCRRAFAAFRKRLDLTVLDDESKLGRNPLTKGAEANIAGIVPPKEWPPAVWEELARQGKIRAIGYGMYTIKRQERQG